MIGFKVRTVIVCSAGGIAEIPIPGLHQDLSLGQVPELNGSSVHRQTGTYKGKFCLRCKENIQFHFAGFLTAEIGAYSTGDLVRTGLQTRGIKNKAIGHRTTDTWSGKYRTGSIGPQGHQSVILAEGRIHGLTDHRFGQGLDSEAFTDEQYDFVHICILNGVDSGAKSGRIDSSRVIPVIQQASDCSSRFIEQFDSPGNPGNVGSTYQEGIGIVTESR